MIYDISQHADLLHVHLEQLESPDGVAIGTGINGLDKYLDPLAGGDFGFVIGRPGGGKCHGRGTKIIMFDGTLKNVEDIKVGDQLMGPDSTPRNVLRTTSGVDQMYIVKQNKGIDYRVSSQHILSLMEKYGQNQQKTRIIEICVKDYVEQTNKFKRRTFGWKPAYPLSFGNELHEDIDWYLIGLWIADGRKNRVAYSVNSGDIEIMNYLHDQSLLQHSNMQNNCQDVIPLAIRDKYRSFLQKYNMWNNKHIPSSFRRLSAHNRLQLLAGYIDGDGFLLKGNTTCIGICTSNSNIRDEIVFLCRSLGLSASIKTRTRTDSRTRKTYVSHEAIIGGNICIIPTKLLRKSTGVRTFTEKDFHSAGVLVEKDTIDEYFGFQIDGDNLYLLEDMTVTHNSVCLAFMCRRASEVYKLHSNDYAPPIFITKEMAIEEVMLRNLSNYTTMDSRVIRKGKASNDWNFLHESVENMVTEWPTIYIGHSLYSKDKRKSITLEFIEESISRVADKYGKPPVFIALDYLQRVSTKTIIDRRLMMSEIVERGKDWALEYNTSVLFGSQASREVDTQPFPVPTSTSGKETGSIEETADWIISVMRPAKYWKIGETVPHTKPERIVTPDLYFVNILKQRNNEANMGVWLSMDPRISELSDLEIGLELDT